MKNLIYILLGLVVLTACSKDKFDDGNYLAEYRGVFEKDDGSSTEHAAIGISITLDNETKDSIDYNGNRMRKKGRSIEGDLPSFSLFGISSIAHLNLKKKIGSDIIEGTFTTVVPYAGKNYDLEGTVILTH